MVRPVLPNKLTGVIGLLLAATFSVDAVPSGALPLVRSDVLLVDITCIIHQDRLAQVCQGALALSQLVGFRVHLAAGVLAHINKMSSQAFLEFLQKIPFSDKFPPIIYCEKELPQLLSANLFGWDSSRVLDYIFKYLDTEIDPDTGRMFSTTLKIVYKTAALVAFDPQFLSKTFCVDPITLAFLENCDEQGIPFFITGYWSRPVYDKLFERKKFQFLRRARGVYLSSDPGLCKPKVELCADVVAKLEELGIKRDNIVYLESEPAYVEPMKTVLPRTYLGVE